MRQVFSGWGVAAETKNDDFTFEIRRLRYGTRTRCKIKMTLHLHCKGVIVVYLISLNLEGVFFLTIKSIAERKSQRTVLHFVKERQSRSLNK